MDLFHWQYPLQLLTGIHTFLVHLVVQLRGSPQVNLGFQFHPR